MSALLSFLGGSAFRMLWGEVAAYFTRKQEHAQEVERMQIQEKLDAAQHARNLEAIRVQANMGIKTVRVQAEADLSRIEASAWAQAVADVGKKTGVRFIDIWNGIIRPALATMAMIVVVGQVIQNGFVLTEWDKELVAGILGIYIADRGLSKRGK